MKNIIHFVIAFSSGVVTTLAFLFGLSLLPIGHLKNPAIKRSYAQIGLLHNNPTNGYSIPSEVNPRMFIVIDSLGKRLDTVYLSGNSLSNNDFDSSRCEFVCEKFVVDSVSFINAFVHKKDCKNPTHKRGI